MKSIKIGFLSLFFLAFLISCLSFETTAYTSDDQDIYSQQKSDCIQKIITKVVADGEAPGMIAAIISDEGVIAIASAGERKVGSGIEFATSDLVHLGSCTKAMTSTMIATLVAEGKLDWESKLVDIIPELKGSVHPDYYQVTMWQLLTHRAGLPKNAMDWNAHKQKEIKERRLAILEDNLKSPATYNIDQFHYSNLGYMIAACMAEQITGLNWEVLMKKRLFDPLGMSSAGFGAPNTSNHTDQPWGHEKVSNRSKWKPDQSDNPEALSPAGRVHCTIADWAKFLSLQLTEENTMLDKAYLNKLIEPVGDHYYAGGWGVTEHDWAKGTVLSHSGSNGVWYTSVVVTPQMDRAFVVATNSRDFGITEDLCVDIMNELLMMESNLRNN